MNQQIEAAIAALQALKPMNAPVTEEEVSAARRIYMDSNATGFGSLRTALTAFAAGRAAPETAEPKLPLNAPVTYEEAKDCWKSYVAAGGHGAEKMQVALTGFAAGRSPPVPFDPETLTEEQAEAMWSAACSVVGTMQACMQAVARTLMGFAAPQVGASS